MINYTKKVRKIRITLEMFKTMLRDGEYYFKIENGLHKDDKLINIEYNSNYDSIDCYFWSETGIECVEGCFLKALDSNSPIFTRLEK